jgi:hypothetical protein
MSDVSKNVSPDVPKTAAGPPFRWKQVLLNALIVFVVETAGTALLNVLYRIRFQELGVVLDVLPLPLLFLTTGVLIILSFVLRHILPELRRVRIIAGALLALGMAGFSIALVSVLNIGAVPLGEFNLTVENIYDERQVSLPRNLENIRLKAAGNQDPGFSLELERRPAGKETFAGLGIENLSADTAVEHGQYYRLVLGEFTVPGPFHAGDTIRINIVNAASFGGKLKLELAGSKNKE